MRAMTEYTRVKYQRIADLYQAGETPAAIMEGLCVGEDAIGRALKHFGIERRTKRLGLEQQAMRDDEIRTDYFIKKLNPKQIAKIRSMSPVRVNQILARRISIAPVPLAKSQAVTRETCFYCGVRSDYHDAHGNIGCKHNRYAG